MLLFCTGSLKLSNSNQGVVVKLFKKCKGQPISKRGTNILTSYAYLFFASFLENYRLSLAHKCKIFFMNGIWKIIQLNIIRHSQIVQKLLGELKFQG